jgi:hypothetical protein
MPDRFSNALLAALNESVELKESDWNSIAAVLRGPMEPAATRQAPHVSASENRFAATISSGMAKVRAGR